jgi:hypothetical protein
MKPPLSRIPADVVAVTDYEPLARERVSPQAWAYIAGGAGDELTLRRNRDAFDALTLAPRVLADLTDASTTIELFGQTFAHPMLLAPVAYQKLAHSDGELATAHAASALRTGMVVSAQATVRIEDIARATQAPLWCQLYVQPDRACTRELAQRAEAAGCACTDRRRAGQWRSQPRAARRIPAARWRERRESRRLRVARHRARSARRQSRLRHRHAAQRADLARRRMAARTIVVADTHQRHPHA